MDTQYKTDKQGPIMDLNPARSPLGMKGDTHAVNMNAFSGQTRIWKKSELGSNLKGLPSCPNLHLSFQSYRTI